MSKQFAPIILTASAMVTLVAQYSSAQQNQTDPANQPVEDPTILWDERKAPFVEVANIRIPKQTFDSEAQQDFCENLSFTPWHALPEHRPVGGINRMRKAVYERYRYFVMG